MRLGMQRNKYLDLEDISLKPKEYKKGEIINESGYGKIGKRKM